jgi:hypothetical protein
LIFFVNLVDLFFGHAPARKRNDTRKSADMPVPAQRFSPPLCKGSSTNLPIPGKSSFKLKTRRALREPQSTVFLSGKIRGDGVK